jgi:hypothetical protein
MSPLTSTDDLHEKTDEDESIKWKGTKKKFRSFVTARSLSPRHGQQTTGPHRSFLSPPSARVTLTSVRVRLFARCDEFRLPIGRREAHGYRLLSARHSVQSHRRTDGWSLGHRSRSEFIHVHIHRRLYGFLIE